MCGYMSVWRLAGFRLYTRVRSFSHWNSGITADWNSHTAHTACTYTYLIYLCQPVSRHHSLEVLNHGSDRHGTPASLISTLLSVTPGRWTTDNAGNCSSFYPWNRDTCRHHSRWEFVLQRSFTPHTSAAASAFWSHILLRLVRPHKVSNCFFIHRQRHVQRA